MIDLVGTFGVAPRVCKAMKTWPLAVASLLVLVSSCTGAREASPSPTTPASTDSGTTPSVQPVHPVSDYSSFTGALEGQGFSVRPGGRGGFPSGLVGVPGQGVFIDGVPVRAFEFPTKKAFDEVRSTIRPRGDTIGAAIINWDPPHFYGAGRLLVLYFGDKQRTLDALDTALGPQFAGG